MMREVVGRLRLRDPLIRLYHRVTCLANDRWSIAVTPVHFAEQMEVLRQRTKVLPLAALDAAPARPNVRAATVVVTFDDGYADNLYEALPILQRFDVPATVFVATDAMDHARASQRAEIEADRAALQSIIDQRIESFAYPSGRAGDYTAETMDLVREAGFAWACTNQAGHVKRLEDRVRAAASLCPRLGRRRVCRCAERLGLRV